LIDVALWVLENWRLRGGRVHHGWMMTKIKRTSLSTIMTEITNRRILIALGRLRLEMAKRTV
jgi:hypothetical protein